MKKIPTLFQRGPNRCLVVNMVTSGCQWVLEGEGMPTRKFDGTCCRIHAGRLWKRYVVRDGEPAPDGFEAAQPPDAVTGEIPGWVLVGGGKEDRWHCEAWTLWRKDNDDWPEEEGTFELVGPQIQGNIERVSVHRLERHGQCPLAGAPRTYAGLWAYFQSPRDIEGIVWHHPDGRRAKLKGLDFGFTRGRGTNAPPPA